MRKSTLLSKKMYTYYIKKRNTKMFSFSIKVFAVKERPVPFFYRAYISVYCSVEYICQGTARYSSRVWYKKDKI
jgi:hypothetical protein